MSTAERRGGAQESRGEAARGGAAPAHAPRGSLGAGAPVGRGAGIPAGAREDGAGVDWQESDDEGGLWIDDPRPRRRMPDAVRRAAVRAVLIVSVTLVEAMVAFLSTLAGSWLAFPMVLSSVASTVVATWAVLDVWITRQVWNQRHGVVSAPSSSARALRRERRRARREARRSARDRDRIAKKSGQVGRQLSHPL
ncbi:hypothetical protein [Streptomyces sp. NPDC050560]|uniref:hypothetical protein n=1 Tax=Streptomyces sp. NPDC050560 TaxID=3365630 RepID=UPI00379AF98F